MKSALNEGISCSFAVITLSRLDSKVPLLALPHQEVAPSMRERSGERSFRHHLQNFRLMCTQLPGLSFPVEKPWVLLAPEKFGRPL